MPSPQFGRRRTFLAAAAALVTGAAMTLTLTPGVATAAAPTVTSVSVVGSKTKVVTSKGKTVDVHINAYRYGVSSMGITLHAPAEAHTWGFPIANTEFTLASTGKGKLAPASTKTSPYAKVALTIAPAATAVFKKCEGQVVSKTQKITLSGTFWHDSRSGTKGWGTVGSKTNRFAFSTTATAMWNYENSADCGGSSTPEPCVSSTNWGGFGTKTSFSGTTRTVYASRTVKLATPVNASRYDSRTVTAKSATLTQDVKAKTAKLVVVGNGKTLTGTGIIRGSNRSVGSYPCGTAGKRISSSSWYPVTFNNGASPLRTTDIFGAIVLPNQSQGYLYRNAVVG